MLVVHLELPIFLWHAQAMRGPESLACRFTGLVKLPALHLTGQEKERFTPMGLIKPICAQYAFVNATDRILCSADASYRPLQYENKGLFCAGCGQHM